MLNRGVEATKFDVKDKSCIYYLIIMKLYNLLNIISIDRGESLS